MEILIAVYLAESATEDVFVVQVAGFEAEVSAEGYVHSGMTAELYMLNAEEETLVMNVQTDAVIVAEVAAVIGVVDAANAVAVFEEDYLDIKLNKLMLNFFL